MIYKLSADLPALLKAKRWNVPVLYGPEGFARVPNSTVIILQRDGAQDSWAAPRGAGPNGVRVDSLRGRYLSARTIGGSILIFAQCTIPNARRSDHEGLADDLADAVYCACQRWAVAATVTGARNNPVTIGASRIVPVSELPGDYSKFTGVIYEMAITIQRAVFDGDADGAGYPVGEIARVTTSVESNDVVQLTVSVPVPEPEPEPEPDPDPEPEP